MFAKLKEQAAAQAEKLKEQAAAQAGKAIAQANTIAAAASEYAEASKLKEHAAEHADKLKGQASALSARAQSVNFKTIATIAEVGVGIAKQTAEVGVVVAKQTLGVKSAEEKAFMAAGNAALAAEKAAKECAEFRDALHAAISANTDAFLELAVNGARLEAAGLPASPPQLYPRPGVAVVASDMTATARRLRPLAMTAVDLAGYGHVVTLAKVATAGISGVLLTPAFQVFVERVLPMLSRHAKNVVVCSTNRYGAREAELALRLYYLGCTEAMDALCRADEPVAHADDADDETLELAAEWVGPSQWLYAAYDLPAPHDTSEWAAWYAAQQAAHQGWITVACVGAASTEACVMPTWPATTSFAAWLLAAQPEHRRAVLTVRDLFSSDGL